MLELCLLLSFGILGIMLLLFFELKDNKRLNNLLDDYRTRRYKDEQTLTRIEELMVSHKTHYRETIKDYKSMLMELASKTFKDDPVNHLKKQVEIGKPSVNLKDFSKRLDSEYKGLKSVMLEGPEIEKG